MAHQFYHLLGHSIVVADGLSHPELIKALKSVGASKELLTQATDLMHRGEELIEQKTKSCGEDRIREHGLHFASDEAEMWLETLRRVVKKSGLDSEKKSAFLASELHTHDHAATVVAKCIRALATLSVDEEISALFGDTRHVRDVINRGHAALSRLIKTGEIKMKPKEDQERLKVFHEIKLFMEDAEKWFDAMQGFAAKLQPHELAGLLGIIPKDFGIPIGGASFAVILHERGQTNAPSKNVEPCSGWSIGRQGNSENLGTGF